MTGKDILATHWRWRLRLFFRPRARGFRSEYQAPSRYYMMRALRRIVTRRPIFIPFERKKEMGIR